MNENLIKVLLKTCTAFGKSSSEIVFMYRPYKRKRVKRLLLK